MELKNKIALVTGASSGIGKATTIALAKAGCSVVINYKTNVRAAQTVLKECNKYSIRNLAVRADISQESDVRKMFEKIKKVHSKLDILVNSAGIFDENDRPTNISAFENIFKTNFLGQIRITTHALRIMRRGKIVNVTSAHGKLGFGRPTAIAYASMKAGLNNYTINLAKQLAPNILVNAVAPGRVATSMYDNPNSKQQKILGRVHLIKRMIQPEEIADAILFLIRNDAMCGEILSIDGGYRLAYLS